MKRSFFGIIAIVVAVVASAFTVVSSGHAISSGKLVNHYFELTDPSQPLKGSSYTEVSAAAYSDIDCPEGADQSCKLVSSSSTLPSNMTDADQDGVPDQTGNITQVIRREAE